VNVGSDWAASTNGSGATEQDAAAALPRGEASGPLALVRRRPELAVGAAFAGGVIAALLLRRLGR
jgi:hypothetical protein